jgi:hypothetical protein
MSVNFKYEVNENVGGGREGRRNVERECYEMSEMIQT